MALIHDSIIPFLNIKEFQSLLPELTIKQLRCVYAYIYNINDDIFSTHENCSSASLEQLRIRACISLRIKNKDLKSFVILRFLIKNDLL